MPVPYKDIAATWKTYGLALRNYVAIEKKIKKLEAEGLVVSVEEETLLIRLWETLQDSEKTLIAIGEMPVDAKKADC